MMNINQTLVGYKIWVIRYDFCRPKVHSVVKSSARELSQQTQSIDPLHI